MGSPHEKSHLDDGEIILHELSHQSLIPEGRWNVGNMHEDWGDIGNYIAMRPLWEQDIHEIYAVAIELEVNRRLRLGLWSEGLISNSHRRNSQLLRGWPVKDYTRLIRRATKLNRVQRAADEVVDIIQVMKKELRDEKRDTP